MPKTEFDAIKFLATVKIWRKMHGFSMVDMAQMCDIPLSTYSFIEGGDRTPKIVELSRLCQMMDFDVAEFFKTPENTKK